MKTLKLLTDIEERVLIAALEQTRQDMGAILLNPGLNCLQAASYGMTQDTAHQLIERLAQVPIAEKKRFTKEELLKAMDKFSRIPLPSQIIPESSVSHIGLFGTVTDYDLYQLDSLSREGLAAFLDTMSFYTKYAQHRLDQMEIEADHEQTRAIWGGVGPLRPVNAIVAEENEALARRGVSDNGRAY